MKEKRCRELQGEGKITRGRCVAFQDRMEKKGVGRGEAERGRALLVSEN